MMLDNKSTNGRNIFGDNGLKFSDQTIIIGKITATAFIVNLIYVSPPDFPMYFDIVLKILMGFTSVFLKIDDPEGKSPFLSNFL